MELQTFSFEGVGVRTLTINEEPYFVGKDVADVLGYQNGSRDINRHVDEDDREGKSPRSASSRAGKKGKSV